MKYYAVIDTNVIVSYLLTRDSGSTISRVMNAIYEELLTPLYNDDILNEYTDVLNRERFHFSKEEIANTINAIMRLGVNCARKPVLELSPFPSKKSTPSSARSGW